MIKLSSKQAEVARAAHDAALRYGDPDPVGFAAQMMQESSLDPGKHNGVANILPATEKMLGGNRFDPQSAFQMALKYRAQIRGRKDVKNESQVLWGYNQGPGNAHKNGRAGIGDPNYVGNIQRHLPYVAAAIGGSRQQEARPMRTGYGGELSGVSSALAAVQQRAADIFRRQYGVGIQVRDGMRTIDEQREYVRKGASKTMNSRHLNGNALDLTVDYGKKRNDKQDWDYAHKINGAMMQASKELGIPVEWGGNWKSFKDGFHWQLPHGYKGGKSQPMQLADNSQYSRAMTDTKPRDEDFSDIFGEWQPSNRFAAPKPEQKPNVLDSEVADIFGQSWQPSARYAAPQPEQAIVAPTGGFNPNPQTKREALTIDDIPERDALTDLAMGGYRGLKDLPGGLAEIAGRVEEADVFNGDPTKGLFGIPIPQFLQGANKSVRGFERDAIQSVRDWNAKDEAEYQAKYGDSGFATAGRIGGNVATAFVPGTGQMNAAKSIGASLGAGKTGMAMLKGAGLGAAQGAVLGTQSADDSIVNNAGIGAVAGGAGTLAGVGIGKLLGNDTGRRLVQSADGDAQNLLSRLQSGNVEYVPNAGVTTAQAAQLPGISQALRAIKNRGVVGGAGAVLDKETMQNAARLEAVRKIADPAGMTSIEAAERAGGQIGKEFTTGRAGMRANTSAIYEDPALQAAQANGVIGGGVNAYNKGFQAMGEQVGGNTDLKTIAGILDSGMEIPFPELQKIYKRVGSIERQANSGLNPDTTTANVAKQLRDIMNKKMEGNPLFDAAKTAKKAEVNTYGKGWVADVTRNGTDNMPKLSGAEIAKKAFSPATNQAENIGLFNKAANQGGGDASRLALKEYAIADMLESSAKAGGDDLVLNPSAAKWIDRRSEALGGLLPQNEMASLKGVGDDLKRYASAEDLGGVRGSATAQNQELLRLGLLDSPLWKLGAKTPLAGTVLEYMSEAQRTALTKKLAKAMADPKTAEKAVKEYMRMQTVAPAMGLLGGVSAPAMTGLLH